MLMRSKEKHIVQFYLRALATRLMCGLTLTQMWMLSCDIQRVPMSETPRKHSQKHHAAHQNDGRLSTNG